MNLVNAIDARDWSSAVKQFSSTVFVDYSIMRGEPGGKVGAVAESLSHVYASHTDDDIDCWDIFGRYHHKLTHTDGGWRIDFMKLIVHDQNSNRRFLEELSSRTR
jgi:hypothetical protein